MSEKVTTASTIIGEGIYVEGDITIHGSLQIDGQLVGNLTCTGVLSLSHKGSITGNVKTREALIGGKIKGNLTATDNCILQHGASLNGDLFAAKVTLSEGSKFNGKCTMIKRHELIVDKKSKNVDLVELSPEEILIKD